MDSKPVIAKELIKCKVSSTLQRDVKQYGKQYLLDGKEDTCWNSEQGSPQWIVLEFSVPVEMEGLVLQFQGGFVGQDCWIENASADSFEQVQQVYPEDISKIQVFPLAKPIVSSSLRIWFGSSTDFFGRVILYQLAVQGHPVE